jgi:HSP20 family protein
MHELQRAIWNEMTSQVRRMMEDFGLDSEDALLPPVDILETGDQVVLSVEVPGFEKEDLVLEVDGRQLTLRGEKREPALAAGQTAVHRERRFGKFERSFTLGFGVDRERISADFTDGVLTVTLPKTEPAKARRIAVGAG